MWPGLSAHTTQRSCRAVDHQSRLRPLRVLCGGVWRRGAGSGGPRHVRGRRDGGGASRPDVLRGIGGRSDVFRRGAFPADALSAGAAASVPRRGLSHGRGYQRVLPGGGSAGGGAADGSVPVRPEAHGRRAASPVHGSVERAHPGEPAGPGRSALADLAATAAHCGRERQRARPRGGGTVRGHLAGRAPGATCCPITAREWPRRAASGSRRACSALAAPTPAVLERAASHFRQAGLETKIGG